LIFSVNLFALNVNDFWNEYHNSENAVDASSLCAIHLLQTDFMDKIKI